MNYNNIVNHLKIWCRDKADAYHIEYANHGGISYVGYQNAYELDFKLSSIIDKSFESLEAFVSDIYSITDTHYYPSLLKPSNKVAQHIIEKTNREFINYFQELLSKKDALELAVVPYNRVILGAEAEELCEKYYTVWNYVNTSYWYPLIGDEPKRVSDKFFVMFNYLEPYMEQLQQLIGLPDTHLYCYGESYLYPEHCLETVEFGEYSGSETIYTDQQFTWAIYYSHENTVSFAGSIVPKVKDLLLPVKDHWDKFEMNID